MDLKVEVRTDTEADKMGMRLSPIEGRVGRGGHDGISNDRSCSQVIYKPPQFFLNSLEK